MRNIVRTAAALLFSTALLIAGAQLRAFDAASLADTDDQTQVVMLSNALLTGTYGLPQQPQIQRLAVYQNYALVQLTAPLPLPAKAAAQPVGAVPPPASGAPPAASPTPPVAASPPAQASGPSSYLAFKTHRNWEVVASKSGSYSLTDLIAAGVPKDTAAGLIAFLSPPRPSPTPSH
jgi:hypothetical protein